MVVAGYTFAFVIGVVSALLIVIVYITLLPLSNRRKIEDLAIRHHDELMESRETERDQMDRLIDAVHRLRDKQ